MNTNNVYFKGIPSSATSNILYFNSTTGEVTYGSGGGSSDTNFANANLTFDGDRSHLLSGFDLTITNPSEPGSNVLFDLTNNGELYDTFTIQGTEEVNIKDLRGGTTANVIFYDTSTGRLTYGTATTGPAGPAGTSGTSGTAGTSGTSGAFTEPFSGVGVTYGSGFTSASYSQLPNGTNFLTINNNEYQAIFIEFNICEQALAAEAKGGTFSAHWNAPHNVPVAYTQRIDYIMDLDQSGTTPLSGSNLYPATYISGSTTQGSVGGTTKLWFVNNDFDGGAMPVRWMTYTYRLIKRITTN